MMGHLRSRKLYVQRHRLRSSLLRVDGAGIIARTLGTITRRSYWVPSPNFLWHIDGTHKLIKWKLVVHAAIDGYSRLVTYCHCSSNNNSTTELRLFVGVVQKYGMPLKVRSDHVGENVLVWTYMMEKHLNRNAVVLGNSVHNQRIERLNRDINTQVLNYFVNLFTHLEETGLLNPANETDLYVLHCVFLPIINKRLRDFMNASNNHPLSTEQNYSLKQLHAMNLKLLQLQVLDPAGSITPENIRYPTFHNVEVRAPNNILNSSQRMELENILASNATVSELRLYRVVSEYVSNCLAS